MNSSLYKELPLKRHTHVDSGSTCSINWRQAGPPKHWIAFILHSFSSSLLLIQVYSWLKSDERWWITNGVHFLHLRVHPCVPVCECTKHPGSKAKWIKRPEMIRPLGGSLWRSDVTHEEKESGAEKTTGSTVRGWCWAQVARDCTLSRGKGASDHMYVCMRVFVCVCVCVCVCVYICVCAFGWGGG